MNDFEASAELCARLDAMRSKRRMSTEELSNLSGISPERLAKLYAGEEIITLEEYTALCSALEISTDTFLCEPTSDPQSIESVCALSSGEKELLKKLRSEMNL